MCAAARMCPIYADYLLNGIHVLSPATNLVDSSIVNCGLVHSDLLKISIFKDKMQKKRKVFAAT